MNLLIKSNFRLDLDQERRILVQSWGSFVSASEFKEAIDKTLEFIETYQVKAILSDTSNQDAIGNKEVELAISVVPEIFGRGVEAMAFILPNSLFTKISLKRFQKTTDEFNVEYFKGKEAAIQWIEN